MLSIHAKIKFVEDAQIYLTGLVEFDSYGYRVFKRMLNTISNERPDFHRAKFELFDSIRIKDINSCS